MLQHTITLTPINIKKLWGNSSNRKKAIVTANVKFTNTPQMTTFFDVQTTIQDADTGILYVDTPNMDDTITLLQSDGIYKTIYDLWIKYHGISIHAGTDNQECELQKAVVTNELPYLSLSNLSDQKEYLNAIGLLQDTLSNNTIYTYGTGLINGQAMPVEDFLAIQSLFIL